MDNGVTPRLGIDRLRLAGIVSLMSFLFGNNFVALDVALRDSGPITIQAVSVTIAAITVWILTRSERLPIPTTRQDTARAVLAVAMALSVASPLLMVFGVERVNPAVAAMLVTTAPIATLVLERLVFAHRFTLMRLAGVVLGVAGVILIVSPLGGNGRSELIGVVVLIGAAFSWAVGLILTRRLRGVSGSGRFVLWQMVAGLPILYFLAFVFEGFRIDWTWSYLAAVGYSGAFAKGTASFLQFRTVRVGSALHSSLAAFMVPAVATVSSYFILRETVSLIQLVGMGLIALAVGGVISTHQDASATHRELDVRSS